MTNITCPKCGMELKKSKEENKQNEFTCWSCDITIEVKERHAPYTVDTLIKKLQTLSENGMGDRFVLAPNVNDDSAYHDYIFIDYITTDDSSKKCIYLEVASVKDDVEWGEKYLF